MSQTHDIPHGWSRANERLAREFTFPDFQSALAFANRVGEIAEAMDHHPELWIAWGKVRVETWTHVTRGLTQKDFALAAAISMLVAVGPTSNPL